MLVAHGTIYDAATVVHEEFITVAQTFKCFAAWPKHLDGVVSDPPPIGKEGSPTPKKIHLSEDDPLDALDELCNIIVDAPMNVPWDSTTFGRHVEIPLYLHQQDVKELALGREEINISVKISTKNIVSQKTHGTKQSRNHLTN
ncbi:hypothetical protein LR48_Vigan10g075300 [Vigna angularis]|uniref:Uncharacterized protein n=1 Tax=Phaseolus angularis TaxID=3914 RepID=A0A0L9VIH5_PHAAN|nr:hypothetical protein LR48_Vigan10g075300 [Vigna angularis]